MLELHFFKLKAFFYYLDQFILHSLNSFLVFLLVSLLLNNNYAAMASAFIFAMHPIHWETITIISNRPTLLNAFFSLSSLIFFLRFWQGRGPWMLACSALCYALALLSKESGEALLLTMIAYLFVFERTAIKNSPGKTFTLTPFILITGAYWIAKSHLHIIPPTPWPNNEDLFLGFSTFLKGVWTYVRLLCWPEGFSLDRSMELFKSALNPILWVQWGLYGIGAFFLIYKRKKLPPILFFCFFWFFIELLPISQVPFPLLVQPGRISLADHYAYLASIPFVISLVVLARKTSPWLSQRLLISPSSLRIIGASLFIFLCLMTFRQGVFSSNELAMIKDSLAKDPQNARLHATLGLFYSKIFPNLAEQPLREAVRLDPDCARYREMLSKNLSKQEGSFVIKGLWKDGEKE